MPIPDTVFGPVTTTRAYEDIVAQIEEAIIHGDLQIGNQLPGEREMAEQFGVSRVVVREAMRNLEARGIVEVRRGSGTYVKNIPNPALRRSLTLLLKLEEASILDLYVVRQALEIVAARSAAQHATAEEIGVLRKCLDEMRDLHQQGIHSKDDFYVWSAKDEEFHGLIAKASHNEPLATLLSAIFPLANAGRFELVSRAGAFQRLIAQRNERERVCRDHTDIANAIANRDPKAAEHFVYSHLQGTAAAYRDLEDRQASSDETESG